jgi:transposase
VVRPDRAQLYWDAVDLESQLPPDHFARVVWQFVESLDLLELYAAIRARGEAPGRPATDPQVLLAVWLYATSEGIGSARAVERLCEQHAAYRWLCGHVPVNYHGLSDFRTAHAGLLDRILTESVASLAATGLISLEEVAIDGTKVAASAGRGSFRDESGLERYEARARRRIERLRAELGEDPSAGGRQREAARARAEREVAERAAAARRKLAALQEEKRKREETHAKAEAGKKPPKASTSDPQARLMKMADGAFRAAYNVIIAATTTTQVVLGIKPTDRRNDTGTAEPMLDDIAVRYQVTPKRVLLDTRAVTQPEIKNLARREPPVVVYSPPPRDKEDALPESVDKRTWRRRRQPAALKAWRERMETPEGKEIYSRRRHIEPVNGDLKNHGMRRFSVCGLAKTQCQALLHAIAHNLRRGVSLRVAAAA